uniref:Ig-like domain-containing protein n=1 Tax=Mastacembelus armatus TaxID=205130 RepID=A0A3Q3LB43_9TELE
MDNVRLMASFSLLFPGLTAGDTISPVEDKVTGREGESVKLTCRYQTDRTGVYLYWYKHHSDLEAPQFILMKRAKGETGQYIPNNRYESQTSDTSTELTIKSLTLADTALYYCISHYSSKRREVGFKPQLHIRFILLLLMKHWGRIHISSSSFLKVLIVQGRHTLLNFSGLLQEVKAQSA